MSATLGEQSVLMKKGGTMSEEDDCRLLLLPLPLDTLIKCSGD